MIINRDGKLELVVQNLDCEIVRERIQALTRIVGAVRPSDILEGDLHLVMAMIRDHLPDDRMVMSN